ncbi:angiopoietin-1-like isoform X2 [Pristis pectinata]|uniref:angiopoietin-1-like isoform X2 n=1 Tax=Pristis pectinata TaxID=685728 RepID=UPI00223D0917|nr:angiopoietin-1-like isoform X2 [Pristis pectinata]
MWVMDSLSVALLWAALAHAGCGGQSRGSEGGRRRLNRVQHGACSYTFILPELEGSCRGAAESHSTNSLQRDAPQQEQEWPSQKLQRLETRSDNNTQWLRKLETYIQDNMKSELAQLQQNAVQNHTATMLEIGTSLLSQTAEHTRRLTDVETQVLNQTSRLEIQLLENSLFTNKLEKELLLQTNNIYRLRDKNSFLEQKLLAMEGQHKEEMESLKQERGSLQDLVVRQSRLINELETQLGWATINNTSLQKQQKQLTETVHNLLQLVSRGSVLMKGRPITEEKLFRDCAEAYQAGHNTSGVYSIRLAEMSEPRKVYCNMETAGGGWTVIQHRRDGSVDFHRTWKEYKMGFGNPSSEHWLGNEMLFLQTNQRQYSLRIDMRDWEGNQAYSLYEKIQVASEKQNYRLFLKGFSGTAGRQSSLVLHGASFSTKDLDHDNCICKCAQMLTGGWWFDACGPSNLNGIYYSAGQKLGKLNGIKWHYFKGPSYSLRSVTMMMRPSGF